MSDAPQITPDHPLSVTLSIAHWRVVMEVLAGDRMRILQDIERQCTTQIARLQPPPMRGNGAAALNDMPAQMGEARSNVG